MSGCETFESVINSVGNALVYCIVIVLVALLRKTKTEVKYEREVGNVQVKY